MKTRRHLKMLALGMAAGLAFTAAAPATVVQGSAVDVTGTGTVSESGGTYSGNVIGGQLTNGSTDINVQAKVSGGEIVYDLDVVWGTMQFEYSYGSVWDPATHSYGGTQSTAGWVTATGLDGTNNKISITNNSNFPMAANFSSSITDGALNASATTDGSVAGIFKENNADLNSLLALGYSSADPTDPPYTLDITLAMDITNLNSGETYYSKNGETAHQKNVFFALSGIPDVGGPTTYTPAGNVTVVITPATNATRETKS